MENRRLKVLLSTSKRDHESLDAIIEEVALRARFLLPVVSDDSTTGAIRIPILQSPAFVGKGFYSLFTDVEELSKGPQPALTATASTVVLSFDECAKMVLSRGRAQGVVVNPYGAYLLLTEELIKNIQGMCAKAVKQA